MKERLLDGIQGPVSEQRDREREQTEEPQVDNIVNVDKERNASQTIPVVAQIISTG